MPAFILLIPFFLVRFGLLSALDDAAVLRAAHFAPMRKGGRAVYWLYQISNGAVFVLILFSVIHTENRVFFIGGLVLCAIGLVVLVVSLVDFAKPSPGGMNRDGIYRLSRNPMYSSYFIFFVGCVVLTQSPFLLVAVLVFQAAAHGVILAEERWCAETFGDEYVNYAKKVRRYI